MGANDQLVDPPAYQNLVIAWRNGAPVRLRDVGSVIDGVENDRVGAWYQRPRRRCCSISSASPAPISSQTADRVQAALPKLQKGDARPASASTIVTDRTETIRASVRDVQFTLAISVGLVVAVIFTFLRSPRQPSSRPSPCRCR